LFKKTLILGGGVIALLAIMVAMAASTVTDRGLPGSNLNNIAGADRSNVAWSFGNDWMTGDDFMVGSAGQTWVVTGIRTWQVGMVPGTSAEFGDRYDSVSLYGGPANPGSVSLMYTGTLNTGSSVNSNPSISHAKVSYADLAQPNYQGSSGSQIQLWQTDFLGLTWVIQGGVKQNFAVDGTVRSTVSANFFNHASNAALSGTPQQGADNRYLAWDKSDLSLPPFVCDSANAVDCGGWDKSSDINVVVTAVQVATNKDSCKKGGWKTLVRQDASSFENQGQCVSYNN